MKILLVDVDSKIPNLALMKLSNHYKTKGDTVNLTKVGLGYYPSKSKKEIIVDATGYDKVLVSIIFHTNKKMVKIINCTDIEFGGVGYSLQKNLDPAIESLEPDYTIYPDNDTSYGFITRGCIRNCPFCVVPKKEGMIKLNDTISNIVKHKKVKFLDNNILAYKDHIKVFKELKEKKIKFQFNQGLDIRLLTDEISKLLSECKTQGDIFFAFDDIRLLSLVKTKYAMFRQYNAAWKAKFFIYCNKDMPLNEVIPRITWCKDNEALPYLMRDINCWTSENKRFYCDLAAWCNQPSIFKKYTFPDFMEARIKDKKIVKKHIGLYEANYEE